MWTKASKLRVRGGLLILSTMLISAVMSLSDSSWLYKASILSLPEHAPFDGTVYPIQKVPDWVKLDSAKWESNYADLAETDLLNMPYYDPEQLKRSVEELTWGNPGHDVVRNSKITYSVPYLGNYLLDGVEGGGSHPAVDIKIPMGTPIFAIANGTVSKASNQSSGFGYHIVITHNNFPSLDNAQANTIVYSSYSHLSENLVEVGDVVTKGQQIALSGASGTATTPHLHFQIDNDQAPWHPFWPFSWQEISEAGLDFFSAINAAFGKDSAATTTINPMLYVQKYMDGAAADNVAAADSEGPEAESYVEEPATEILEEPVVEEPVIEEPPVEETVVIEPVTETPIEKIIPVVEESPVVEEANDLLFSDVPKDHPNYEAIVYLANADIIQGYDDGTFRPDQTVNRVEALKFILESTKTELKDGDLPFKDTADDEWYVPYLYTGYLKAIVNGHPDGSFKPADTVNKAEFFKILFNGMSVDINPNVEVSPYEDVAVDDWFVAYIAYAKEVGLIDSALTSVNASGGMSRGEVALAMYKLIQILE